MPQAVKQLTTQLLHQEATCNNVGFWKLTIKYNRSKECFILVHDSETNRYTLAATKPVRLLNRGRDLDKIVHTFNKQVPEDGEVVVG